MSGSNSNGGIGLSGILLVVFIVLKLTGNIGWSWWWVLSPLWISAAVAVVAIVVVAAYQRVEDNRRVADVIRRGRW